MDITEPSSIPAPDAATDLAHRLIRFAAHDTFDSFMVHGHPFLQPWDDQVVRACFYYALVVTPKIAILYDNDDAGGMCRLEADEVRAVWRTLALLAAFGTDFEALRDGKAILAQGRVPKPAWTWDSLATQAPTEETGGRDAIGVSTPA